MDFVTLSQSIWESWMCLNNFVCYQVYAPVSICFLCKLQGKAFIFPSKTVFMNSCMGTLVSASTCMCAKASGDTNL